MAIPLRKNGLAHEKDKYSCMKLYILKQHTFRYPRMTSSSTGHSFDDFIKLNKLGEGTYGVVFKVAMIKMFRTFNLNSTFFSVQEQQDRGNCGNQENQTGVRGRGGKLLEWTATFLFSKYEVGCKALCEPGPFYSHQRDCPVEGASAS